MGVPRLLHAMPTAPLPISLVKKQTTTKSPSLPQTRVSVSQDYLRISDPESQEDRDGSLGRLRTPLQGLYHVRPQTQETQVHLPLSESLFPHCCIEHRLGQAPLFREWNYLQIQS